MQFKIIKEPLKVGEQVICKMVGIEIYEGKVKEVKSENEAIILITNSKNIKIGTEWEVKKNKYEKSFNWDGRVWRERIGNIWHSYYTGRIINTKSGAHLYKLKINWKKELR